MRGIVVIKITAVPGMVAVGAVGAAGLRDAAVVLVLDLVLVPVRQPESML